jgi:hypothetical protein
MEEVEAFARVLKRHPYTKTLLFIDVVFCNTIEDSLKNCYSFASVVIKTEEPTNTLIHVVAGDVIRVTGVLQNYEESCINRACRYSILVEDLQQVTVVEKWRLKEDGFFSFENIHVSPFIPYHDGKRLDFALPIVLLQVRHKCCERIIAVLKEQFSDAFEFRESSTCLIKSKDRLVLMAPRIDSPAPLIENQLIERLVADKVLAPHLLRVYPGALSGVTLLSSCSASFSRGFEQIMTDIINYNQNNNNNNNKTIHRIRIQCFPKNVSEIVFDHPLGAGITWSPQEYDFVMSVAMVDGLFLFSLAEKEKVFVGDTREKKKKTNNNNNNKNSTTSVVEEEEKEGEVTKEEEEEEEKICRAQAKLEEIMRRNHWIFQEGDDEREEKEKDNGKGKGKEDSREDKEEKQKQSREQSSLSSSLFPYSFAVDIGASPGGWTAFMSRSLSVRLVLSVDKGKVAFSSSGSSSSSALPNNVFHWKIHGEDAIETLIAINNSNNNSGDHNNNHDTDNNNNSNNSNNSHADGISFSSSSSLPGLEVIRSNRKKIDLFCCDANISPFRSLEFLTRSLQNNLLASRGRFVVTLKNVFPRKDQWESCLADCQKQVRENPVFREIQLVHLLANTPKETTLTGSWELPV